MGSDNKKPLIIIFSLFFTLLIVGTIVIAIELQHVGIASILLMASVILAIDVRKTRNKNNDNPGFIQTKS